MIAYVPHPATPPGDPSRRTSHSLALRVNSRVALVDYRGQIIFCTYVLPTNPVTDYRTSSTGITAADLQGSKHH